MNLFASILSFLAESFGLARQYNSQKNSPTMQANAAANTDAVQADSAASVVEDATKSQDGLEELRKAASE